MKTLSSNNRSLPKSLIHGGFLKKVVPWSVCVFFCTNTFAQGGYEADANKLRTKASRSNELYVEPSFNFDTYHNYTLDFYVADRNGDPVGNVMIMVSSIPVEVSDIDDPVIEERSFMSILKTDQFGRAYKIVEASYANTNLLVELKQQVEGNKMIIDAHDKEYISHSFTIN
jgi:hypothetical protein